MSITSFASFCINLSIISPKNIKDTGWATPFTTAAIVPINIKNQSKAVA